VRLAGTEHTPCRAPGADDARPLDPDDKIGTLQAKVETDGCEIAVADPAVDGVQGFDDLAELRNVGFRPIRLPDAVEANERNTKTLSRPPRESGLATSSTTENDDAPRRNLSYSGSP